MMGTIFYFTFIFFKQNFLKQNFVKKILFFTNVKKFCFSKNFLPNTKNFVSPRRKHDPN